MTTHISVSTLRVFLFFGGVLFFLILELAIPYRHGTVSKLKRWINNLSLTAINSALLILIFSTAIVNTGNHVIANKIGVMNIIQLPGWART